MIHMYCCRSPLHWNVPVLGYFLCWIAKFSTNWLKYLQVNQVQFFRICFIFDSVFCVVDNGEISGSEDQLRYTAGTLIALFCIWENSKFVVKISFKQQGHLRMLAKVTKWCSIIPEIQWRYWSTLDLSLMMLSAMQHSPNPAAHFSLVFHYFDGNSPLLSFLKFHEEFILRNNYKESKKYLQEFHLNMDKVLSFKYIGWIWLSITSVAWLSAGST